MNYKKHYDLLIETRKKENRKKTKETRFQYNWHHILPKCYGGTNDKNNLVLLTSKEHFIAHWLLWKIHGAKMALAFHRMTHCNKDQNRITSKVYEILRKEHAKVMSEQNTGYVMSQSQKNAIGKSHKGKKRNLLTRVNMSLAQRGKNNSRADKTERVFYHQEHGLFVGIRCELVRKFGLNFSGIGRIISGIRKIHRGWVYIGEKKNICFEDKPWTNPELFNIKITNKPKLEQISIPTNVTVHLLDEESKKLFFTQIN